ncbi:MAG: sugar phosphate isomerase/epimerase [Phycisphaerae bacterium]|nr:sugar phosphate isomerase/epimerase [Phycisphaerae bacterium]
MRFSHVLPDLSTYVDPCEFDGDLARMKQAGYDAVELQIADPAELDEKRLGESLAKVGYNLCAFQTGSTYAARGNCLSTADKAIRRRTVELLKSFVDLAARWNSVIVFGSLQGRLKDEPDRRAGGERIVEAIREVGEYATAAGVVVALEPVNHSEVGFHNTIAEASALVRRLNLPGIRLMVDTYHMNIEEKDMLAPLSGVKDILAHVHLSETNRDVLGTGHWPAKDFLRELDSLDYAGFCSVGVYNTRLSRRDGIRQCAAWLSSQCGVLHAS